MDALSVHLALQTTHVPSTTDSSAPTLQLLSVHVLVNAATGTRVLFKASVLGSLHVMAILERSTMMLWLDLPSAVEESLANATPTR